MSLRPFAKKLVEETELRLKALSDALNRNANAAELVRNGGKPTASAKLLGRIVTEEDAGGAGVSRSYICHETAAGVYSWVQFAP
jgi:hypothetical protein